MKKEHSKVTENKEVVVGSRSDSKESQKSIAIMPDEILHRLNKDSKLYSKGQMLVSSFFGGPFVAVYIIAENFKSFGDEEKANWVMKTGYGASAAILAMLIILPDVIVDAIPSVLIPILYLVVANNYMDENQGNVIKKHFADGGLKQSHWKAIGVAVLGFTAMIAYFFVLSVILPW